MGPGGARASQCHRLLFGSKELQLTAQLETGREAGCRGWKFGGLDLIPEPARRTLQEAPPSPPSVFQERRAPEPPVAKRRSQHHPDSLGTTCPPRGRAPGLRGAETNTPLHPTPSREAESAQNCQVEGHGKTGAVSTSCLRDSQAFLRRVVWKNLLWPPKPGPLESPVQRWSLWMLNRVAV